MIKLTKEYEFHGSSSSKQLKLCSKCEKVGYFLRECQEVQDHQIHKIECKSSLRSSNNTDNETSDC
jgi:hypothetical protein